MTGDDDSFADEDASDAFHLRPEVVEELEKIEKPRSNWLQGILVLGVTLLLFVGGESLRDVDLTTVGMLLGVLVFHEAGHLLAMRVFDYRDLRMFFLPMMGAAASGRKHDATGTQRAIVSLAGPLPGLALGALLLVVNAFSVDALDPSHLTLFGLLVVINAFNLLPFEPLDGGRFMNTVLFSRAPTAEAIVRILGAFALGYLAYVLDSWLLAGLAFMMLITTPMRLKVARTARKLAREVSTGSPTIPAELRETVAYEVWLEFEQKAPKPLPPRAFAGWMHQTWLRAQERPPPRRHTALLMAVYLATLGAIAVLTYQAIAAAPATLDADTRVRIEGDWALVGIHMLEGEDAPRSVTFYGPAHDAEVTVEIGQGPADELLDRQRNRYPDAPVYEVPGALFAAQPSPYAQRLRIFAIERDGVILLVDYTEPFSTPEKGFDNRAAAVLPLISLSPP